jgi:hypothetical protein
MFIYEHDHCGLNYVKFLCLNKLPFYGHVKKGSTVHVTLACAGLTTSMLYTQHLPVFLQEAISMTKTHDLIVTK